MFAASMATKAFIVGIFMISAVSCHYDYFSRFYGYHGSDDTKQKICDRDHPCPDNGVCCLRGFQGRCFYGSYAHYFGYERKEPQVTENCIREWGDKGVGSTCSSELECEARLVCEGVTTNKWGTCQQHICIRNNYEDNPCGGVDGHWCEPTKETNNELPDSPDYKCDCLRTRVGNPIPDLTKWMSGKHCDIAHPCADERVHMCGDNGRCERDPTDPDAMRCVCEPEWYGEKCNHEGICLHPDNACLKTPGTVCYSTGANTEDYRCDCTDVPGKKGRNCDEDVCDGGCGTGECVNDEDLGFTGDIFNRTGHCECKFNTFGKSCEDTCGGNEDAMMIDLSPESALEIKGSDALCIYEEVGKNGIEAGLAIGVKISESEGLTADDPFCHKYYVEVFQAESGVPLVHRDGTGVNANSINRFCTVDGDEFTWTQSGIPNLPARIVISAKKWTKHHRRICRRIRM